MNKILETIAGSHMYGLNNENSDIDISGIYLESNEEILEDYLFSSDIKGREVDLSEVYKLPNGKNSPDSVDKKYFSLKKYIALACNNNPNINELLYSNNYISISPTGQCLVDMRKDFLSKKLFYTFSSYAERQAKKARLKTTSYLALESLQNLLEEKIENKKDNMFEFQKEKWFTDVLDIKQHHLAIKSTSFQITKNRTVKSFIKEIEKMIGQRTNRKDLIKKKSFDSKFMSHTIRLLCECNELLTEQHLTLPLRDKDRELVMAIKNGDLPLEEVERIARIKSDENKKAFENSLLPAYPNRDRIYKFIKEVYHEQIKK